MSPAMGKIKLKIPAVAAFFEASSSVRTISLLVGIRGFQGFTVVLLSGLFANISLFIACTPWLL
jgi:hypothetical protein